jgi:type I restriction-modification system DNA methylase subunit
VAGVLKDFIHKIGEHDFSKINYEVLGNIFQRLIPEDERHKLGQYFTRPDVVDLIVGFCVRSADDRVLDGGCGAGTFLVRSYVRKKILNPNKTHRDIIRDLYGIDIAKFPAHLSIINLASRDLSEVENYPNILHGDFFNTLPGKEYLSAEVRVETLSGREKFIKMPEAFDAVVMNPPYTRQEEMEDVLEEEKKKAYKRCIEDWKAMSKYRGKEPKLSKRSSIYVHFFIHGGSFLKEGGRLGLITSNSWLDVDYGGDLQRFFLENFKVKAIIESKVERWFEDADINTAITILERCSNPEERNNNMVRFVQLKKPLAEFIPPVENENERWAYVEKLIEFIESKEGYYEDDRIRVFTKTQKELWDEGYDEEKEEYMGSKWGKYIRAPEIFFKVLGKEKNLFIPLKEVAEVKRGFTTGANEFFYLTEEEIQRWSIEREFWMHPLKKDEEVPVSEDVWKDKGGEYFKKSQYTAKLSIDEVLRDDGHVYWIPNYVIKSPRECKSILINPRDLKYRVLMVHKNKSELRGTNVLKYIERGENQGFHLRPTCKSRQRWYDINIVNYPLVWRSTYDVSFAVFYNKDKVAIDKVLYGILPKKEDEWILCTLLNASIVAIFAEMHGTVQLGQGALFTAVYEIEKMPIINPLRLSSSVKKELRQIMEKLHQTSIDSVFEEIGANSPEEVSLDKVKPDRRELDRIIMGEILGLTEEEQLEVYRAVIDLVKSRIERAKSVQKRRKVAELDIDELVDSVLKDVERVHGIQAKRFPEDYIGGCPYRVVEVPRGSRVEAGFDIKEGPYVQIDGEKIKCNSIYEAKFIEYAVLAGKTRVTIPTDEGVLRRAVEERAKLLKDARARLEEFLNETIADRKLREKVRFEAFRRLGI